MVIKMTPFLQNAWGEDNDCTLTCMTAIIYYYLHKTNPEEANEIYNTVEKTAKKYFYDGTKRGTNPIFINRIFSEALAACGVKNRKANGAYGKNIGFNFDTIKKYINKNVPVILSLSTDGNNYYRNHSITIIGYENDNDTLYVYDNWVKDIKPISYKKLSMICSINYAE